MKNILCKLVNEKDITKINLIRFNNKEEFDFVLFYYGEKIFKFDYKKKELEATTCHSIISKNLTTLEFQRNSGKCYFLLDGILYKDSDSSRFYQEHINNYKFRIINKTNNHGFFNKKAFIVDKENKTTEFANYNNDNDIYNKNEHTIFKIKYDIKYDLFKILKETKEVEILGEKFLCKKLFGRKNCNFTINNVSENEEHLVIEYTKIELKKDFILVFNKKTKKIIISNVRKKLDYKVMNFKNKTIILGKESGYSYIKKVEVIDSKGELIEEEQYSDFCSDNFELSLKDDDFMYFTEKEFLRKRINYSNFKHSYFYLKISKEEVDNNPEATTVKWGKYDYSEYNKKICINLDGEEIELLDFKKRFDYFNYFLFKNNLITVFNNQLLDTTVFVSFCLKEKKVIGIHTEKTKETKNKSYILNDCIVPTKDMEDKLNFLINSTEEEYKRKKLLYNLKNR